mmetsp:Transcript_11651/g.33096  ORF Transcript_11651/g.33096 Transcript_11651/m.33096 type:complete len:274 (-) Transcript_11651:239-1060(-)
MRGDEVPSHTNLVEGVANGIEDEDRGNERCKDFIGEAAQVMHDTVQIDKGGQSQEETQPQSRPGIEGEKGDVHVPRHLVDYGLDGKDGTSSTINHHGHAANNSVENTIPCRGGEHLDGAHVVVRAFGVHSAKGDGRSDGGEEDEDGNADGLEGKVGHLLAPVRADGGAEVLDDASAPRQLLASVVVAVVVAVVVGRAILLVGHHGILDVGLVGVVVEETTRVRTGRRLGIVERKADEVVFVGRSYSRHECRGCAMCDTKDTAEDLVVVSLRRR